MWFDQKIGLQFIDDTSLVVLHACEFVELILQNFQSPNYVFYGGGE